MKDCCTHNKTTKNVFENQIKKSFLCLDGLLEKGVKNGVQGFTMKSSYAPYNDCLDGGKKYDKGICILVPNKNNITGKIHIIETRKGLKVNYEYIWFTGRIAWIPYT